MQRQTNVTNNLLVCLHFLGVRIHTREHLEKVKHTPKQPEN
jgi:hypothetical protein